MRHTLAVLAVSETDTRDTHARHTHETDMRDRHSIDTRDTHSARETLIVLTVREINT